jgi:hypothetical protein
LDWRLATKPTGHPELAGSTVKVVTEAGVLTKLLAGAAVLEDWPRATALARRKSEVER